MNKSCLLVDFVRLDNECEGKCCPACASVAGVDVDLCVLWSCPVNDLRNFLL